MLILYVIAILSEGLHAVNLYDEDDPILKSRNSASEDLEFEPVMTLTKDKEKLVVAKNINCEEFAKYAMNCTFEAALMYNSSKKAPPMPAKVGDWCNAIRHLTNCAIDWNSDCKDVTESHFNEESIRGHMHVVNNICDDEWFLSRYDVLPVCIEGAGRSWESCYSLFKVLVDEQKNTTHEWTHFDTHFHMCCVRLKYEFAYPSKPKYSLQYVFRVGLFIALVDYLKQTITALSYLLSRLDFARAQFRRCTLDTLFDMPDVCPYEQAVTLQKFSVIVSEGDVFQDCDTNMMYTNCPGGDPRPSGKSLAKLMNAESFNSRHSDAIQIQVFVIHVVFLILLCGLLK